MDVIVLVVRTKFDRAIKYYLVVTNNNDYINGTRKKKNKTKSQIEEIKLKKCEHQ